MVKIRPSPSEPPLEKLTNPQKQQMQLERKRDILLLLEHLIDSQEVTIKMILEALYDIGATNWIDARIRARPLNRTVKSVARLSRPVFRRVGLIWFRKNCPQLIVDWLYSKVKFEPEKLADRVEQTLEAVPVVSREREVKELRSQVRLLTGSLVAAIALLGGTSFWLGYNLQNMPASNARTPGPEAWVRESR